MTNKQIIIDGVDVSGCEFYKNTLWKNCYSRDYKESVCQSNYNCHYKNLKRQERKCDMWENIAVENGAVALKYQQQIDQLKAENENWQKEYWKLEQGNDFWAEKNSRLRGCLTEIKEIAETAVKFCKGCGGEDYECINCMNGGRAQISQEILQKIGEV